MIVCASEKYFHGKSIYVSDNCIFYGHGWLPIVKPRFFDYQFFLERYRKGRKKSCPRMFLMVMGVVSSVKWMA